MATVGTRSTGKDVSSGSQAQAPEKKKPTSPAIKKGFFGPSPSAGPKPPARCSSYEPSGSAQPVSSGREKQNPDTSAKKGHLDGDSNASAPSDTASYPDSSDEYPQLISASDSESEYDEDIDLVQMFTEPGRTWALTSQDLKDLHAQFEKMATQGPPGAASVLAPTPTAAKPAGNSQASASASDARAASPIVAGKAAASIPAPSAATTAGSQTKKQPAQAQAQPATAGTSKAASKARPAGEAAALGKDVAKPEAEAAPSKQSGSSGKGASSSLMALRKELELASEGRLQAILDEDKRKHQGAAAQKNPKTAKRKAQAKKSKKARRREGEAAAGTPGVDAELGKAAQQEPESSAEEDTGQAGPSKLANRGISATMSWAAASSSAAGGPADAGQGAPAIVEEAAEEEEEEEEGGVAESYAASQNPFDILSSGRPSSSNPPLASVARQKGGPAARLGARGAHQSTGSSAKATEEHQAQWQVEQRPRAGRNRPGPRNAQANLQGLAGGHAHNLAGREAGSASDVRAISRPRPSGRGRGQMPPGERHPRPGHNVQAPPKRGPAAEAVWRLQRVQVPQPQAFDSKHASAWEQEDGEEHLCIVCMEWPAEVVLSPCNHSNVCQGCANKVRGWGEGLCPSCRTPIEGIRLLA